MTIKIKIFKEEESIEILKIFGLNNNRIVSNKYIIIFKINMTEENVIQEFRLKNINNIKRYFIEKIKHSGLLSKKHKKICTTLNYTKHLLIVASMVTGCISILAFASLVGIPVDIVSVLQQQ